MLEAESDQLCVPAEFGLNCWTSCVVAALLSQSGITFGHLRFVSLHQNLSQSKDVESTLVTICLHDRRHHRRRQLFIYWLVFAVTSPMVLLLVYLFFLDVDSEHEDHSEVPLLFVGCIVNFIVSFLICMFQDSVPAGSYNDPFLSSVISMVTPTWCHGAIGGNRFQGEWWLSWLLNSHILTWQFVYVKCNSWPFSWSHTSVVECVLNSFPLSRGSPFYWCA